MKSIKIKKIHNGHKIYFSLVTVIVILMCAGLVSWFSINSLHKSTEQYVQTDELLDSFLQSQLKAMEYRFKIGFNTASDATDTIIQTYKLASQLTKEYQGTEAGNIFQKIENNFRQYETHMRQLFKLNPLIKKQEHELHSLSVELNEKLVIFYHNLFIFDAKTPKYNNEQFNSLNLKIIKLTHLSNISITETSNETRNKISKLIKILTIEVLKNLNELSEDGSGLHLQKVLKQYQIKYDTYLKTVLEIYKIEQEVYNLLQNTNSLLYNFHGTQLLLYKNRFNLNPLLPLLSSIFIISLLILIYIIQKSTSSIVSMSSRMRLAKIQAEKANETKTHFLNNISHEIRTPMNAIIGLSHILINSDLNKKQRQHLDKVHKSAESLLSIINNILDFSNIEADKLTLETSKFKLYDLFENLSENLSIFAYDKNIELIFDIPVALEDIYIGDQTKLNQVLLNIVNNAIKFTEYGEVIVTVMEVSRKDTDIILKFNIKDSGAGINLKDIEHVFDAFCQADGSLTRKHGGTGLGLAISQKFIELMGGEIWVESEVGKGSEFNITTQLKIVPNEPSLQPYINKFKNINTLVINESMAVKNIITQMLREFGMMVTSAESGYDALSIFSSEQASRPFELILMDWKMSSDNDFKVLEKIHYLVTTNNYMRPKIILVTDYGQEEFDLVTNDLGVDAFVNKPVTPYNMAKSLLIAFNESLNDITHHLPETNNLNNMTKLLAGSNILLVEDNEINSEVTSSLLSLHKINVTCAINGKDALLKLQRERFDGVLMDCQMPVMDGYKATQVIRKELNLSELPIIAMIANTMLADKNKALDCGMNDYIEKPFNINKLFSIMRKWITPSKPEIFTSLSEQENINLSHNSNIINFQVGLEICSGSVSLYQKLLKKFADSECDFLQRFENLILEKNRSAAKRQAHSLRGVSGNIGAANINNLAEQLERSFDDGQETDDNLIKQVKLIDEKIFEVIELISQLDFMSHEEKEISVVMSQDIIRHIRSLKSMLEDNNIEANEIIEDVEDLFNSFFGKDKVQSLIQSIDDYEFEDALSILETLNSDTRLINGETNE